MTPKGNVVGSNPETESQTSVYNPSDPNEIIGTKGYDALGDTLQWVAATTSLPYTIYFENDPELATAAAQKVEVRHRLHAKADISTFAIGAFGFGSHVFTVEGNRSSYQQRLDLTQDMGIYVDVVAGIDIVAGEAFWILQSIDPATGLPPQGTQQGFLPVNDENHSGEGYVSFTIKPKANACITGDELTASASIVFDINEAIPTNVWYNTVDALPPTTQLTGIDNGNNEVLLQFSGQDDEGGCGIKQYKLYVSDNYGAYSLYEIYPVGTTATYLTEYDHCYRFFCLGEDNVGNVEGMKEEAEFEYGNYNLMVSVAASPEEGGTVNGGGLYTYNLQVMVTAIPASGYEFYRWVNNGVPVSEEPTYTFSILEEMNLVAQFIPANLTSHVVTLAEGLNWWSSYVDLSNNGLASLEEALGSNGITINSQKNSFAFYDENDNEWYGLLSVLDNREMYRIQTNAETEIAITGARLDASQITIETQPGWNWIGYPVATVQSVADALLNLQPDNEDVLKSQTAFAMYDSVDGWFGLLTNMEPGKGYMYMGSQAHSFQYHSGRTQADQPKGELLWKANEHAYADNMSMVAVVAIDDEEQHSGQLEVGAFSQGKPVGSTRLLHNAKRDRWYAMLPVSGNGGEQVSFRLYDVATGEEYSTEAEEAITFTANAVAGTLDNPMVLNFRTVMAVDENTEAVLRIHPNPTTKGGEVRLGLPAEAGKARVEIYNMLDVLVDLKETDGNTLTLGRAIVPGTYILRVYTASEKVYYGKLIVK
ncbi:MAG: T9SS type A sorting domain-containing protein [Bacteroidales bacterium]|nr:T9SS type A sorting domain-containing protein [Bacteroidales bacterium]